MAVGFPPPADEEAAMDQAASVESPGEGLLSRFVIAVLHQGMMHRSLTACCSQYHAAPCCRVSSCLSTAHACRACLHISLHASTLRCDQAMLCCRTTGTSVTGPDFCLKSCMSPVLWLAINPLLIGSVAAGTAGSNGQDPEPTWVARHPLKLRSAYSEVTGAEPPYTTCHSKFLGTVDYMWYTPNVRASAPPGTVTQCAVTMLLLEPSAQV